VTSDRAASVVINALSDSISLVCGYPKSRISALMSEVVQGQLCMLTINQLVNENKIILD
jgi:hypothetical protein